MTEEQRTKAIMDAWKQIQDYVHDNYAGVFAKDMRFRWKHEVYQWVEFGVTPEGYAFIVRGCHGWGDSEADFFYHPGKTGYDRLKLTLTEQVVRDWPTIKRLLQEYAEKENALYNFQI